MDGLNLILDARTIEKYFKQDKYGLLIPDSQHLQMQKVAGMIDRQNKADTGYFRRVSDIDMRTDVEFTNNPYGNTVTIGAGFKLFGRRPFDQKSFKERTEIDEATKRKVEKRENKILINQLSIEKLYKSLEPTATDHALLSLWLQEGYQTMTGGGFDGNSIGEVSKSGLNFVVRGSKPFNIAGSKESMFVVQGSKWLREKLEQQGMVPGSLKPEGATLVRMAQESDGMIGWPVYAKSLSALTKEIATSLLIVSGIDTRSYVDSAVIDVRDGKRVKYRVVDALAYILDHSNWDASDVPSIITLLARIQKHGWKHENGETIAKPSKTRSIYPNSALAGIIEAMTMAPFDDRLKELKASFMPSLQDKRTRVDMIWKMLTEGLSHDYDFLAADWSKYDATVKGSILATVIYYAVRPFFNAQYYQWVDFCIYALVYKYVMFDSRLCKLNNDLYSEALNTAPHEDIGNIVVFGLVNGLISGAKFTHVGGSMYGEVVIHYCIPLCLGYEPMIGAQAGDDTLMAYPKSMINLSSPEITYTPIAKAAAIYDLDMNVSKQDWWVVDSEVGKVFLQDVYHYATGLKGIGSIFRPYDAIFFSERNKNLSIAEQLMAEISRMNQGADNPFAPVVVKEWLAQEELIGVLFKEYGESAFEEIVKCIGLPPEEIAQRIDVGSFTFGVAKEDLQKGTLPILPVIAAVAAKMDFKLSPSQAFRMIGEESKEGNDSLDNSTDPNDTYSD